MIPKIIHYCWFGGNPLPELAQRCIASWRKFLPDYEIWQWVEVPLHENEDEAKKTNPNENSLYDKRLFFDVNMIPYTAEAYRLGKYAFVSDYARFWILYKYGGLYFDTDVEVIRPMDDIIEQGCFMGCESDAEKGATLSVAPGLGLGVNPGLGLGVNPGLGLIKKILAYYESAVFDFKPDIRSMTTVVHITTEILKKNGLEEISGIQKVDGVYIYPREYFCPINVITGKMHITSNTRTVHHYSGSWIGDKFSIKDKIKSFLPEWFVLFLIRAKSLRK